MSPRVHRLGLCTAGLALCASFQTPAVAGLASVCDSLNIVGAVVCGQIQGSGATYGQDFGPAINYATFTVNGAPSQTGLAPVALSGAVAGVGLYGGVGSSGYFGQAHVYASANDQNPQNSVDQSRMNTQGNLFFADEFTVGGTDTEARFTVSADGSFAGFGSGQVGFQLDDITPYLSMALVPQLDLGLGPGLDHVSQTFDFVLAAGHSYELYFSLEADAIANEDSLVNMPAAAADMSHTGTLYIDPVNPDQSLSFVSGHDYRTGATGTGPTPPAPPVGSQVPEPPAVSLFFLGLAAIGTVGRRRVDKGR